MGYPPHFHFSKMKISKPYKISIFNIINFSPLLLSYTAKKSTFSELKKLIVEYPGSSLFYFKKFPGY